MSLGPSLRGALFGLAAMSLYAGYDISVKFLGGNYSAFQIMFFAFVFAVPLMMGQMAFDPTPGTYRPKLPRLTALRVVIAIVNGLLGTYAFATLPLAQCYAIFFTMPLLITLLAVPILGEPISLARGLAVLAGLVGVVIALEPGAEPLRLPHLAAMAAAATGALNYVILRKAGAVERPAVLIIYPMLGQLAVTALILPFVYVPMPLADLAISGLMALFLIAGSFLIVAAYNRAPAILVAPMQYCQIIWAALASAVLFLEPISPATWAGLALVIGSGLYILTAAKTDTAPA
jgi:S-adenosylmethionine uptake transporter